MTKFINIERARIRDFEIADGVVLKSNVSAFVPGDHVQVTEKIDGANSSITYDPGMRHIDCFSSNKQVSEKDGFRGFWEFVSSLTDAATEAFQAHPSYLCFGEWEVPHTMTYNEEAYNRWYLYDILDKESGLYLPQEKVRAFADESGLDYIHAIYDGAFQSWEHVQSLLSTPSSYGDVMEGIVIKNQDRLNSPDAPFYLKIVNDEFKETKIRNHMKKIDGTLEAERKHQADEATELVSDIVTMARIRKLILKMVDEGMLPNEITPEHMGIIAKNLPRKVFEDCVKEEKEIVDAAGKQAMKACSKITMGLARKLILGE